MVGRTSTTLKKFSNKFEDLAIASLPGKLLEISFSQLWEPQASEQFIRCSKWEGYTQIDFKGSKNFWYATVEFSGSWLDFTYVRFIAHPRAMKGESGMSLMPWSIEVFILQNFHTSSMAETSISSLQYHTFGMFSDPSTIMWKSIQELH